jgi:hypothetical protein
MRAIHIGLVVTQLGDNKRKVSFNGQSCPLISRTEERCERDTSFYGCVISSTELYSTPRGVARRTFAAWGGGLEHSATEWEWPFVPGINRP